MKKEIKIGILTITALGMLVFGINYLKGINLFKSTNHFYVAFDDVAGVALSSPVFANGYQIGLVRDIHFDYDRLGKIIVEVKTDKAMRIPKGSYAELVTEMLGTVKMNVWMNAANKTEFYATGDTLAGVANKGLMAMASEEMIPKLKTTMSKLDTLLTSLNRLLSDPALPATFENARRLTSNLTLTTTKINALMANDIPRLTDRLSTVANNFAVISDNLKEVDYAATLHKVDSTLSNVRFLSEKLTRRDNSLGLLLNDDAIYQHLNRTAINAASLLDDLKTHPTRYVHFSLFGKKDKTNKLLK